MTHHLGSLHNAIQKVARHSEWLMKEFEMHAAQQCDRRQAVVADYYIQGILNRLTIYAAKKVMKHVGRRFPQLLVVKVTPIEVSESLFNYLNFQYRVRGSASWYAVNAQRGVCDCNFYESMWLPCVHLIRVFRDYIRGKYLFPYYNSRTDASMQALAVMVRFATK